MRKALILFEVLCISSILLSGCGAAKVNPEPSAGSKEKPTATNLFDFDGTVPDTGNPGSF